MVQMACIGPLNTHESGEGCILKSPYYQNSLVKMKVLPKVNVKIKLKVINFLHNLWTAKIGESKK